jgi:hypothetical protein
LKCSNQFGNTGKTRPDRLPNYPVCLGTYQIAHLSGDRERRGSLKMKGIEYFVYCLA